MVIEIFKSLFIFSFKNINMKKLFIKVFLFSGILGSFLLFIDPYFLDNSQGSVSSYNSLYDSKDNSTDIVFLGNSHLAKGIDTYIIDAKCSTNSIKFCTGGINIVQIYYNLREVLTTQSPKLVALELWPVIEPDDIYNRPIDNNGKLLSSSFKGEYYKRFGTPKFNEISLIYPETKLYNMFNFFRFHENWTSLDTVSKSLEYKLSYSSKQVNYNSNKVLWYLPQNRIAEYKKTKFETDKIYLSEQEELYLNKIIDLSKEYDFNLLFFNVPIYTEYYNKTKNSIEEVMNRVQQIANENKNVFVYNINKEIGGLDYSYVMGEKVSKNQHLNYKGIIKTSNLMANYINQEKTLVDVKGKSNALVSIEKTLYNSKKIPMNPDYLGNVIEINNRKFTENENKQELIVFKYEQKVIIEGWMFKKGINLNRSKKMIALKKDSDFVFVSGKELVDRKDHKVIKRYGENYIKSGYRFELNKVFLEKGRYKLYHIIESHDNELHVQDMWKWVIIK